MRSFRSEHLLELRRAAQKAGLRSSHDRQNPHAGRIDRLLLGCPTGGPIGTRSRIYFTTSKPAVTAMLILTAPASRPTASVSFWSGLISACAVCAACRARKAGELKS